MKVPSADFAPFYSLTPETYGSHGDKIRYNAIETALEFRVIDTFVLIKDFQPWVRWPGIPTQQPLYFRSPVHEGLWAKVHLL